MCDYKIVEIERSVGGSFGFSVIGGVDTELPPMVCALVHNGSAQLSGKVHVGDVLVEVNDECVSRLPAKQVVKALRHSPDILKLRLRKDPAAVARARPYLRRYSVQDPKLNQFQTKFRRSASLPSRSKRPVLRSSSDAQQPQPPQPPGNMSRGKTRVLGQESPSGIDRGTDGTFRRRMSGARSGSFSKITTSFPAHGGPPHTVENAERTTVRHAVRTQDLTRTVSDNNCTSKNNGPLHSASLPEIGFARVNKGNDGEDSLVCRLSASAGDGLRGRRSLNPANERTTQNSSDDKCSQTSPGKDSSYGSLSQGRSCENNVTVAMDASPYPFRRPLDNSFGVVHNKSENHKGSNGREKDAKEIENSDLPCDELARRLYNLDGFNKNEVSPMLFKNDDYTKKVAVLFMKHFDFHNKDLVESLRILLDRFNLTGETQERERILIPFSNRYHECNKPEYGSADAVHTLVCAIMLLNTDLHGEQTLGRRMKQTEFIKNLSGMCDENDYPISLLKSTYASIKSDPLHFHTEIPSNHANNTVNSNGKDMKDSDGGESIGSLALMGYQTADDDVIYKEGLLYRKLIEETGGKKASAWKRGWQPFYATLRGMIMYLHKPDEARDFDDTRFSLGVHHAFASPAFDYKKRAAVFRFITADWKVLLFQARDKADMLGWVEGLNLVAATYSSPPLPAPVGSCKRFQKPVLPFSRTTLTLTQQLDSHETKAQDMADVLIDHLNKQPQGVDIKQREMIEWLEKRDFYDYEYKRYRSYTNILKSSKLQTQIRERGPKQTSSDIAKRNGLLSENMRRYSSLNDLLDGTGGEDSDNANNRKSYFMAIYKG